MNNTESILTETNGIQSTTQFTDTTEQQDGPRRLSPWSPEVRAKLEEPISEAARFMAHATGGRNCS
jgi:hypothetical protein